MQIDVMIFIIIIILALFCYFQFVQIMNNSFTSCIYFNQLPFMIY